MINGKVESCVFFVRAKSKYRMGPNQSIEITRVHACESGEAEAGGTCQRLAVEQLVALCQERNGIAANR